MSATRVTGGASGGRGEPCAGQGGAGCDSLGATRRALIALGAVLSLWLWARSQVGGDQLNLLARGWLLAVEGELVAHGNPLSSGGNAPGAITSLLVGLPLLVWRHHLAATLVVPALHLIAVVVLDRALGRLLPPRERLLFVLLYWLGAWRLCYSGFLWNPNYLFLPAAVHLATAAAERDGPRWPAAAMHAAAVVLAVQIHPSGVLLGVASVLLLWRGYWRPSWAGLAVGALLGSLPLVPWALAVASQPELATAAAGKGFPGRGLLLLAPWVKGLVLWLRYPSLAIAERMLMLDFAFAPPALGRALGRTLQAILPLTMLVPVAATVWQVRCAGRRLLRRQHPGVPGRIWLRAYAVACLVAAAVAFAVSPTTPMSWQALVVLHASVLPVVLWAGALLRTRRAAVVWRLAIVHGAAAVALVVVIGLGAPQYSSARGATRAAVGFGFPLGGDHVMLHELGIHATREWPIGSPGDWWPDVLVRPTPAAGAVASPEVRAADETPQQRE